MTSALITDFYELAMAQGYFLKKHNPRVVFDMFYRTNPFNGGYLIFTGLEELLTKLENFRFSKEDIDYLRSLGQFDESFLSYLSEYRFHGNIYAFDEGPPVFPGEPLIRVESDLIDAQLVETIILNTINFQSLIATKASRMTIATKGRGAIMEFGLRRAQGEDGGHSASRASFIGGTKVTSNTYAGKKYGIPVYMTEESARALIKDKNAALLSVLRLYPPLFSAEVGDMRVSSFISPHDSACCVGYRVEFPMGDSTHKIGVATDIGHIEPALVEALLGVDECIIESNHDVSMLITGPYPYTLKRRILSERGHLSNEDCGKIMNILAQSGTHAFMLAHLSKENNYPPTAELTAKTALSDFPGVQISVASPNTPTEIRI